VRGTKSEPQNLLSVKVTSELGLSGGRDRHRSDDLTLFRSDLALNEIRGLTGENARMSSSKPMVSPSLHMRSSALVRPVSRSYGHAMGTTL